MNKIILIKYLADKFNYKINEKEKNYILNCINSEDLNNYNYLIFIILYYIQNEYKLSDINFDIKKIPKIDINKIIWDLYENKVIFICYILIKIYNLKESNHIIAEYDYIKSIEKKINEDIKWDKEFNYENHSLKYINCKNGSFINRLNIQIESKPIILFSLINEIDLYPKFLPFCKFSESYDIGNLLTKNIFIYFKLPIFSINRIMAVQGQAYDLIWEKKQIIFICKDIETNLFNTKEIYDKLKIKKEPLKVKINVLYIVINITNKNSFIVDLFFDFNIKIPIIPNALINLVMKYLNIFIINKLKNLIKNIEKDENNPWAKKLENDQEFFNYLIDKIKLIN